MRQCRRYGYLLVFAVFYLFLLCQFSKVFLYYDDYGYLSLSYGTHIDVAGSDYSFPDLLAFIKGHYTNSNGRLLYMFLYGLVYLMGGLRGVQIFMATAVLLVFAGLFFLAMALTERRGRPLTWLNRIVLAAFLCLLYGSLGIMVQRAGTYWYAASFIYVVPAIAFLAYAALYGRTALEGEEGAGLAAASVALSFLASWSQEQWFVASFSFTLCVIGAKVVRHIPLKWQDGLAALASLAGGLIIMLSPAVAMRMNSETNQAFAALGLFGKLQRNLPLIGNLFFSGDNLRYLLLFFPMMLLLGALLWHKDRGKRPLHLCFLALSLAAFAGVLAKQKFAVFTPGAYSLAAVTALLCYLAFCFAEVLLFCYTEGQLLLALIFTASVLSAGSASIVPEVPLRVFYPFFYLSFLLFGCLLGRVMAIEGRDLQIPAVSFLLLLFAAFISLPNLKNIYQGYRANYQVLRYDDAVFRESAEQIRRGEEIGTITVYMLLDPLCANEMAYDPNFSFMSYWMKEYYDLPQEVTFDYRTLSSMEDLSRPAAR